MYIFISSGYNIDMGAQFVMKAEEIKLLRHRLRLSQKELARQLGVTLATVGRWECGLREPSSLAVRAMEPLLEVDQLQKLLQEQMQE